MRKSRLSWASRRGQACIGQPFASLAQGVSQDHLKSLIAQSGKVMHSEEARGHIRRAKEKRREKRKKKKRKKKVNLKSSRAKIPTEELNSRRENEGASRTNIHQGEAEFGKGKRRGN